MEPHHAKKFRNVRMKWSTIAAAFVVMVHSLTGCDSKPGVRLCRKHSLTVRNWQLVRSEITRFLSSTTCF